MGNVLWPLFFVFMGLTAFAVAWALTTIIPVREATATGVRLTICRAVAWLLAILVWYEGLIESVTFKLSGVAEPAAVTPTAAVAAATKAAAVITAQANATAQATANSAAAKAAAVASVPAVVK